MNEEIVRQILIDEYGLGESEVDHLFGNPTLKKIFILLILKIKVLEK